MHLRGVAHFLSVSVLLIAGTAAWADDGSTLQHHQAGEVSHERSCHAASQDSAASEKFEGVQIETSDLTLYE